MLSSNHPRVLGYRSQAIGADGIPCPSCGKHFKNNTRVLQHMSQPTSRCNKKRRRLQLVRISYSAAIGQRHRNRSNNPNLTSNPNADIYPNNSDNDQFSLDVDNLDDGSQSLVVGEGAERGQAVEFCPNVPQVYTGGNTFMADFDRDSYTSQRHEVPWYPFAGKNDWEVAHWLMRANLSMSEIDEYLNLNFVSFPSGFLILYRAHIPQFIVRRRRLPFRSTMPRSYANGWRCYHRAHGGSTKTL
jgi:hypothetical protein